MSIRSKSISTLTHLIIAHLIVIGIGSKLHAQSSRVLIRDWTPLSFESKYGNPINISYKLERSSKRADYMDNRFHYFIKFLNNTSFQGKAQPVWVGFEIKPKDTSSGSISFGKTLQPEKQGGWDFWNPNTSVELEFKLRGWIGTYLNEMEKNLVKNEDCAAVIREVEDHAKDEFVESMVDQAKNIAEFGTDVFESEIADFIGKYSKTMKKFWGIYKSTPFGVLMDLADPVSMDTPKDAFISAHERVRGHMYVLEEEFKKLGTRSKSIQTITIETQEVTVDFWDTPENPNKNMTSEDYEKIKRSIQYSQQELKKEMHNLKMAFEGIKIEKLLGTSKDDECKYKALDEYFHSYMYNANALLSIELK